MPDASGKKHVLIMDDSLDMTLGHFGIDLHKMFDGSGKDIEVSVALDKKTAEMILRMWADLGIKPDMVCVDFLYGHDIGPIALEGVLGNIYRDKPALKPTKIFAHSKSGLQEYEGDRYGSALRAMERIGAEYCHTNEIMSVASKFGSEYGDENRFPPASTRVFRNYLRDHFGVDVGSLTREDIERNRTQAALAGLGDKISMYDAHEAVQKRVFTPSEALGRIDVKGLASAFAPELAYENIKGVRDYDEIEFKKTVEGAATGVAAFTLDEVRRFKAEGKKVILVLEEFAPSDAGLLSQVDGVVLLGRGSSHLPILCENFGIPGIFGQDKPTYQGHAGKAPKLLSIQKEGDSSKLVSQLSEQDEPDAELRKRYNFGIASGQEFSITSSASHTFDDNDKEIIVTRGELHPTPHAVEDRTPDSMWIYEPIMRWADDARRTEWHRRDNAFCHGLGVKANADNAEQVRRALDYGADGIGLLRTEHMLLSVENLPFLQTCMLAEDDAVRTPALAAIKSAQRKDFLDIFKAAGDIEKKNHDAETYLMPLPVTMRLLDSKPDELLPRADNAGELAKLAAHSKLSEAAVKSKVTDLITRNVRGAQFAMDHMDIYAAQAEAFFEAAKEAGIKAPPEIMVPMVKTAEELAAIKAVVDKVAQASGFMVGDKRHYRFGTMIETKEAVRNATAIAKLCDFISFGTNDLTTELTGLPRDDIAAVEAWMNKTRERNPYQTLCPEVRAAMTQTVQAARAANERITINVCGGQVAGDNDSIAFCQSLDISAISVPANSASLAVSRIIAGQQALAAYEKVRAENQQYRDKIAKIGAGRKSGVENRAR